MRKLAQTLAISILFIFLFVDLQASNPYPIWKGKQSTSPLSGYSFLKKRWGPDIIIGGVAGLNFSNVKGADAENTKIMIGSQFGFMGRLQYSESTAFQTGILFSGKGYRAKSDIPYSASEIYHEDFKVHLNYIEIPWLLRISFHENFIYNIDLGAYTSFLVSAQKKGTSTQELNGEFYEPTNINDDYSQFYHTFDLGLQIGGGVQYQLTHKRKGANISAFANAGMQIGLRTVSNIDQIDYNNRTYQVGVGILFHLDQ